MGTLKLCRMFPPNTRESTGVYTAWIQPEREERGKMSPDSSHKTGGRERQNVGGHRRHGGARTGDADSKASSQPEGCSQQPLETPANSRQVLGCCRQGPVLRTLVIKLSYWDLGVARNRWPWSQHHAEPEGRRSLLSISLQPFLSHSLEHWSLEGS